MQRDDVRNILFRVELQGQGVVNFDSGNQSSINANTRLRGSKFKNIKYGKANYWLNPKYSEDGLDDDGNATHEPKYIRINKISSACLRHAIHAESQPFHSPIIFENPSTRYFYMTSEDALLRGYMYAPNKGATDQVGETVGTRKRASGYSITEAEEVSGAVSTIEIGTSLMERTSDPKNSGDEKLASTSLYYTERLGKTKYKAIGSIDIAQLMFVSASPLADRLAILPDDMEPFKDSMIQKYGEDSIQLGYFGLNTSTPNMAEYGFLLSDKLVNQLIKALLIRIAKLNITKSEAYARVTKIEIKYVSDPLNDTMLDIDGWNTIFNLDPDHRMNFCWTDSVIPHRFYSEASPEEIAKITKLMEEHYAQVRAFKKSEAESKKLAKAAKSAQMKGEE
jgi:hypothetical protein